LNDEKNLNLIKKFTFAENENIHCYHMAIRLEIATIFKQAFNDCVKESLAWALWDRKFCGWKMLRLTMHQRSRQKRIFHKKAQVLYVNVPVSLLCQTTVFYLLSLFHVTSFNVYTFCTIHFSFWSSGTYPQ